MRRSKLLSKVTAMSDIDRLIAAARAELGVKESPPNSNRVKYCTEYGVVTAWCVIFVWWLFRLCGLSHLFYGGGKCASCSQLMAWAKSHKQWVTKGYKRGDLLLYDWNGDGKPEHIGLCVSVSGGQVTAIEGNTSVGNNSDGGEVMTRVRSISSVLGAVRPAYGASTAPATSTLTTGGGMVMVEMRIISKGSTGAEVKTLQRLLYAQGYKGKDGKALSADGDFGTNTDFAFRAYQKAQKLNVDGKCGPAIWNRLLRGV